LPNAASGACTEGNVEIGRGGVTQIDFVPSVRVEYLGLVVKFGLEVAGNYIN